MTKEDYKKQLEDKGYDVELKDGLLIVYTEDFENIEEQQKKLRHELADYRGSFGIRRKDSKSSLDD